MKFYSIIIRQTIISIINILTWRIKLKKFINILAILITSFYIVGCSPKYNVLVDSRTSQEFEINKSVNDKYKILFDYEKNKTNFDYKLVYDSVLDMFKNNGYNTVDDIYNADYIVFIDFKVNGPHKSTINYSMPITGQIGVNTYTTYGPYGATNYSTPKYGTIGYSNYQTIEIYYTHLLSLNAYSFSKKELELDKKIWEIILVTSNESNDFRKNLPALLLVLEKYIMTDTHGNLDVELYEKQGKLIEGKDLFKKTD